MSKSKHNDTWCEHQSNINKIYKDLIKYQQTRPEYNLSKEIGLIGKLIHNKSIDVVGIETELFM